MKGNSILIMIWIKLIMKKIDKMSKGVTYLLMMLSCIFLSSCNNRPSNDSNRAVEYWYNREVIFPEDLDFRLYGRDTMKYDYSRHPFKVLILLGSTDCIACKLNIDGWQRFIEDMDSLAPSKISFVFVLEPLYKREIYTILRGHEFLIPVCLDENREFRKNNKIVNSDSFIFLLDRDNRVLCTGNPLSNSMIREVYKECIQ